jgi:hypothetical protein
MAFLRFTRDTRGYEHFYLVQQTTNRRGKVRPRLLYWFRTPPNVKVGRQPFDEAVRRALEAQNPDIHFDWQAIVDTPIPPPVETERWREKRRFERAARQAAAEEAREAASEPVAAPEQRKAWVEGPADFGDDQAVRLKPDSTEDSSGFGEAGKPDTTEDSRGFGEPGKSDTVEDSRGFDEPGPDTTFAPGEPRADAAQSQSGPLDPGRRKRRRRRGRRSRPPVAASPGQSAVPDPGVPAPLEDIEPSDPEGE